MLFDIQGKGKGYVAIWANIWFDEDNSLIGYYDSDYSEAGTIFEDYTLTESISHFSYGNSFQDSVVNKCSELNISYNKIGYIWILYDYFFDFNEGKLNIKNQRGIHITKGYKPYFLGNFKYSKS